MKVLINLIGGQPAPVYIATRLTNPDLNVLIYSNDSEKQVSRIKSTLSGYNYETYPVLPYDFGDCFDRLNSVIQMHPEGDFILNPTSGTKVMSFAGFRLFSDLKKDILYIDSQNHNSIYFKNGSNPVTQKLEISFPIEDYFSIYGYRIEGEDKRFPNDARHKELRDFMERWHRLLKNMMPRINKMRQEGKTLIEEEDDSKTLYLRYNFRKQRGITRVRGRNAQEVQLLSQDDYDYITGYWMEDYVFYKFKEENMFDEILKNVKIFLVRDNLQPEYLNEFDICGIRDQTIYIFECKTGNLDKSVVEKLRLVKEITGTYSKIHLITLYRPLESASLERIRDFNIKHVNFEMLDDFMSSFRRTVDINPNL